MLIFIVFLCCFTFEKEKMQKSALYEKNVVTERMCQRFTKFHAGDFVSISQVKTLSYDFHTLNPEQHKLVGQRLTNG